MLKSILYSSIRSPHCLKVAIFLTEKGIPFERVEVDLRAREQKTPEFLAINPLGLVPVYEDDQGIHPDSLHIMQYLDRRYPNPRFFPQDPNNLQKVLDWIAFSSGLVRDVSHHLYWQLIEPPASGTDWTETQKLKESGIYCLARIESALKDRTYVCGDLTAADFALLPWIHGYRRFDLLSESAFPLVSAWLEKLTQRSSFIANYQKRGRPFSLRDETRHVR